MQFLISPCVLKQYPYLQLLFFLFYFIIGYFLTLTLSALNMIVIQTLTLVHKSFYSHSRKSSSGTHKRCVLHFQWLHRNFNYSFRLAYSCSSLSLSSRLHTQMHTPLTVMFGALIRALPGNMQLVGEKVQNLTSKSLNDTMDRYFDTNHYRKSLTTESLLSFCSVLENHSVIQLLNVIHFYTIIVNTCYTLIPSYGQWCVCMLDTNRADAAYTWL